MAITKLVISGADSKTISLAHKAQATSVVPDDNITATNVQDALEQLDDIKAQATNGTLTNPTISGSASFGDNAKAKFGAGNDLQIYHDGSNSYIRDDGTGELRLNSDNAVRIRKHDNETLALFSVDGSATLYHNNLPMIATTSTGIDVTGNVDLPDNGKLLLGAGDDLQIYHDGSNSYVKDAGTGTLNLQGSTQVLIAGANGTVGVQFVEGAGVNLRHNNSPKLATTSTGIDVTGTATMDGLTVNSGTQNLVATFQSTDTEAQIALVDTTGASSIRARNDLRFHVNNSETPALKIDSAGNVGIGTASPTDTLNVSSSANQIGLDTGDQATYGTLDIGHFSNGAFIGTQAGSNASANTLRLGTTGSERMRIDSSGNVGIGTDSPDSKLHVRGSSSSATSVADGTLIVEQGSAPSIQILSANTQTQSIKFGDPEDGDVGKINYSHATNHMALFTDGTEAMRIDSSGVVNVYNGIDFGGAVNSGGTVSSSNKLDDYEEGTWTPAASGYDGTMTVNSAAYTKIGRLVHLRASVTFSDTADGSIIQITGLPFAQGTANTGRGGSVTNDSSGSVAFTDGSASTVLRMLSNTHSTVTYTAVRGATVEFFHIYDA